MSAVCICCSANSRCCTPLSSFVSVGKNSRSIAVVVTSELLRTTKAFHIDETRSVFPNLSCREIVDCSHCIGKSRFCCHLSSQREQLLLKLCNNLLHRHRHRSSTDRRSTGVPPAFRHTQTRQATTVHQASSQLRALGQLSTTTNNEPTILALPGRKKITTSVNQRYVTMMK